MTFKQYRFKFRIADINLRNDVPVENFRWVRKMLGLKPNPMPMMSRIDIIRMIKSRRARKMPTPNQKWAIKKAQQFAIEQGWGIK